MSFNIEFRKHGLHKGYLECCPPAGGQIHVEGCPNDIGISPIQCECPWNDIDNQLAIIPADSKLVGICLTAFVPSDAEAIIEFDNKKIEMPYDNKKSKTLRFDDLIVAHPKKGEGVRVRLTKPTKHPLVMLMFQ